EVPEGVTLTKLDYLVTKPGMRAIAGSIPGPPVMSTFSRLVSHVPVGAGYAVRVSGATADGLINTFGRDAVGDDLTTFGGNGGFLHGAARLPVWLALGGDFRGAFASEDVQDPNGSKAAAFPMQADAQARLVYCPLSFYGVLGFRGQVRSDSDVIPLQNYQPITASQLVSREHYFMLRASPLGAYIRAGRFFAPFGLRLAEHFLYVRRDLGFNTLEESYNLSSGYVAERWEVHVTAFAPDILRHMGSREGGVAGYGELRFADVADVALQARVADGP
ncbi:MAG: hypothetical protein ABUL67_03385, partial [Haliangium ochraceum]